MSEPVFYDFWRSSCAYRVRIALNLKGMDFRAVEIDLPGRGQEAAEYRAVNPQGLVPSLEVDGQVITQSLAIIDWLDGKYPDPPLFPADPFDRAKALAQALTIAADTQPLQNTRVQRYLKRQLGVDQQGIDAWVRHWISEGLAAIELQAPEDGFLGGDAPNIADVFLVPQMYNARRFGVEFDGLPRLVRIDAALCRLDAFAQAAPEAVNPQ